MSCEKIDTSDSFIIAFDFPNDSTLEYYTEEHGYTSSTRYPSCAMRMTKKAAVKKADELAKQHDAKIVVLETHYSVAYEVTKNNVKEQVAARKKKETQSKIEKLSAQLAKLQAKLQQ